MADLAKSYSFQKYSVSIIEMAYGLALLLFFLGSGLSLFLEQLLRSLHLADYLLLPAFLLISGFLYYLFNLPLNYYAGFSLEHKFNLTKQKAFDWWKDQLKVGFLSYLFSLILISVFYGVVAHFSQWWLVCAFFWIAASLILVKVTPSLIIPLFFKYKKLEDEVLRQKIYDLAKKMQVKLLNVFEIDFSKKTLKANAAFTGFGKSKRVILADTLKDKYNYAEIETILAHEFAHYRLKHLVKLIILNALITLGLFYLIFRTNIYILGSFKLNSLNQLASLPLVFLYFSIFGILTRPLEASISRRFEHQADSLALEVTKDKAAFISLMEKLAAQNLADRNPHPLIKFFFFDHPPIDERISRAKV